MGRYHQDEEVRVEGERHAGIVIKGQQLLLVHRIKDGREYYVFPGGHRRQEEKGEQTAIREVLEETGIIVDKPKLAITFTDPTFPNTNYYYLCDWLSGNNPHLTGEEMHADPSVDLFDPMWVDIKDIKELNILPKFAKEWLFKYLKI